MTKPLFYLPAAQVEVVAAHDWYEKEVPGLGERLRLEIDRQAERICAKPSQFPVVLADVRRARLRHFPYAVFFRALEDGIYVIAFFHSSRNPAIWKNRA